MPDAAARPRGIGVVSVIEPANAGDLAWQTSADTIWRSPTLYDLMKELLPDGP